MCSWYCTYDCHIWWIRRLEVIAAIPSCYSLIAQFLLLYALHFFWRRWKNHLRKHGLIKSTQAKLGEELDDRGENGIRTDIDVTLHGDILDYTNYFITHGL